METPTKIWNNVTSEFSNLPRKIGNAVKQAASNAINTVKGQITSKRSSRRGNRRGGRRGGRNRKGNPNSSVSNVLRIPRNFSRANRNPYSEQGFAMARGGAAGRRRRFRSARNSVNNVISYNTGSANEWVYVPFHEVLAQVYSSNTYQVKGVHMNPGLTIWTPWVSNIAVAYEEFWPQDVVVSFISSANYNMNNLAAGSICMSIDYDCKDAPPTSIIEQQRNTDNILFKPQIEYKAYLSADPSSYQKTRYFTLDDDTGISDDDDIHNYSPGKLWIGVEGTPATEDGEIIGEIVIDGIYKFKVPKTDIANYRAPSRAWQINSMSAASPMGTSDFTSLAGECTFFTRKSATEIQVSRSIPARTSWLFNLSLVQANASVLTMPLCGAAYGSFAALFPTSTPNVFNSVVHRAPQAGITANSGTLSFIYTVPDDGLPAGDVLSFSGATLTGVISAALYITYWNYGPLLKTRPELFLPSKRQDVLKKKVFDMQEELKKLMQQMSKQSKILLLDELSSVEEDEEE
jgi:hypothetical protein